MTATAEKRKNPARRAQILQRELDRRQAKLQAAVADMDELESGQQEVVAETLRADPRASAFQRGGPASERERKASELEKTAAHLRQEIVALEAELAVAGAEQAAEELAEATKEAERITRRELELRQSFGEAFGQLAELSNELMATLGARGVLVAEARRAQIAERAEDPAAVAAWEVAILPAVEPIPSTFAELIQEALAVSTGSRAGDEDPETLRQLNAHRASLGLVPELRSISRSRQALEESYPDLRQVLRTADGGPIDEPTPPRAGEPIAGLAEAGFGVSGGVVYANDGQALPPAVA